MGAWSMRTLAVAATFYAWLTPFDLSAADLKAFKAVDPPRPLPEIAVMTLEGEPGTLAAAFPPGRPVVLNLWATWCAPCVKELPSLVRLRQVLGDEAAVAALSVDRGGVRTVGLFLEKTGISGLIFRLDPRADSLQALQARGLPTTIVLNAQHQEVARFEGPAEWDDPAMLSVVRSWISGR